MKVLIVNTILMGDKSATGTTMKNMLYKMPDVEFRQYCIDYRIKDHAQLVDTIFMDIKDAYIDKVIAKLKKRKILLTIIPKLLYLKPKMQVVLVNSCTVWLIVGLHIFQKKIGSI